MKINTRWFSTGKVPLVCLVGAIAVLAAVAGEAKSDDKHHDAFVNGVPDENRLITEIRHQLVTLPYFGVFDDLAFQVSGTTVTLVGQVSQPVLKGDAESAVKHIEGVTSVVNQIEVLPLSPNDDQIRRSAYRAIYGDPALSTRYGYRAVPSIHIIVKNGQLKLEGVVANQADKDLINIRANGVPNAFHVENDLQVEPKR